MVENGADGKIEYEVELPLCSSVSLKATANNFPMT